jgi:hypothetical protein
MANNTGIVEIGSMDDLVDDFSSTRVSQSNAEALAKLSILVADTQEKQAEEARKIPAALPKKDTPDQGGILSTPGFKGAIEGAKAVGAVAADVAVGVVVEGPGAVAGGVREAGADVLLMATEAMNFLEDLTGSIPGMPPLTEEQSKRSFHTREDVLVKLHGYQENTQRTVTGNLIRDITSFSVPFLGFLSKIAKIPAVVSLAGKAPKVTKAASAVLSAGFAGFIEVDRAEKDLEALLRDNPQLRPAVSEFMSGDPGDSALGERTKNGLAVSLFGLGAEAFMGSIKGLRAIQRARHAAREVEKQAQRKGFGSGVGKIEGPQVTTEDVRIGSFDAADEALIRHTPSTDRAAAKKLAAAEDEIRTRYPNITPEDLRARASATQSEVEINFDRIDSPEAVEKLMQDVTDVFASGVQKARRGKQTFADTAAEASRLDIGIKDVLERRTGAALNDAQTHAYREVWVGSAKKLEDLARAVVNDRSATNVFKFRKGLSVFNAINESVLGARAEAGRALSAWRMIATGDGERAKLMSQLVDASGGERTGHKLAETILGAIDSGASPGQLNIIARRSWGARTFDAVAESAVAGLLWLPSTHVVNVLTNQARIGLFIAERGIAGRIGQLTLAQDGVALGEGAALWRGTMGAYRAMLSQGAEANRITEAFKKSGAAAGHKIDVRLNSITAESFNLSPENGFGAAVEAYGNLNRLPFWALRKSDDFFKTIGYTAEIEAQAFRQATREGASKGKSAEWVAERIAELRIKPPEHIRLAASDSALYNTFTQDTGKFGKLLMETRRAIPASVFIMPFVRTPVNILRYSFEFSPLAPLVGQWRNDIAAGGAKKQIALARLALGTMSTGVLADWAWEGHIQGALPRNPGVREAYTRLGIQPDSVMIGDKSFRLNRFDPIGLQASLVGGLTNILKMYQLEDEDMDGVSEILAAIVAVSAESILSKSTLTGLSRFSAMMNNPERRGEKFIEQTLPMLLPLSSLLRATVRLSDEETAQVSSVGDSIQQMIVGLESRLPRRRDGFGDPKIYDRLSLINPFTMKELKDSPIDKEISALGINFRSIPVKAPFMGENVDFRRFPEVYEEYRILAGKSVRSGGKTLRESLDALVSADKYKRAGEDIRKGIILKTQRAYRNAAQAEIMRDPKGIYTSEEFERFRDHIPSLTEKRINALRAPENNQ